jgi:anti-sigma regulatory factor (Ser/Thr protein kinase)
VVCLELATTPTAPSVARLHTRRVLSAWRVAAADVDNVELVVSELVTNAIRHADAPIRLRLIQDQCLICEVSDGSAAAPHPRRARTLDEGGRGLLLVGQLTDRWGTRQTPTGKIIWAEQCLPTVRPGETG